LRPDLIRAFRKDADLDLTLGEYNSSTCWRPNLVSYVTVSCDLLPSALIRVSSPEAGPMAIVRMCGPPSGVSGRSSAASTRPSTRSRTTTASGTAEEARLNYGARQPRAKASLRCFGEFADCFRLERAAASPYLSRPVTYIGIAPQPVQAPRCQARRPCHNIEILSPLPCSVQCGVEIVNGTRVSASPLQFALDRIWSTCYGGSVSASKPRRRGCPRPVLYVPLSPYTAQFSAGRIAPNDITSRPSPRRTA